MASIIFQVWAYWIDNKKIYILLLINDKLRLIERDIFHGDN